MRSGADAVISLGIIVYSPFLLLDTTNNLINLRYNTIRAHYCDWLTK
jgi:hypothetical protein